MPGTPLTPTAQAAPAWGDDLRYLDALPGLRGDSFLRLLDYLLAFLAAAPELGAFQRKRDKRIEKRW